MRFPIASDGIKFIAPAVVLTVVLYVLTHWAVALVFGILSLFLIYFFRDFERTTPGIENAIFASGDGLVDDIEEVEMADFPGGRAMKVGCFLSLFNCHVTRCAVNGKVKRIQYKPGMFLNAMREDSGIKNENNTVLLETETGPIMIRQIAGMVARRIVCTAHIGQQITAGERIGLIRMGSRVEVYFPTDAELRVKKGMKVAAGQTVLAILKSQ